MDIQLLSPELLIHHKQSYFETLSNLVLSPSIPDHECTRILDKITAQQGYVFVAIDSSLKKIVGTGTVYIQQKLSKGGVLSSQIEELSVHPHFQGQGIGSLLIEQLLQFSRTQGCYKAILNCEDHYCGWYERFGFEKKEVEMKVYL